jgi:AraC family transcriptional regulator
VREHIGDGLSIAELANLLQLSPAYFCKALSKTHGVTPHRFVLNQRIVIVMEALRQPSAPPIAELAHALGFADQAHFSNVFRKLVGHSSSKFRNHVR